MYLFFLIFDWLALHSGWVALAGFILVSTLAISWYFERKRP